MQNELASSVETSSIQSTQFKTIMIDLTTMHNCGKFR